MPDNQDLEQLKKLDILTVAESLKIPVRNKKAICFLHADTTPSLTFYPETGTWHCFGCGKGGDVIALVQEHNNCTFRQACQWLRQSFIGTSTRNIRIQLPYKMADKKPTKKEILSAPDSELFSAVLQHLSLSEHAVDYLCNQRKLSLEAVKSASIVSAEDIEELSRWLCDHFSLDRLLASQLFVNWNHVPQLFWQKPGIIIPYFQIDGKLINFQIRPYFTDKAKKYMFLPKLSTCMLNEHTLNTLPTGTKLFVCEGAMDALSIETRNGHAVAFPGVQSIKTVQLELFQRFHVHIIFDNDEAGKKATSYLEKALRSKGIQVTSKMLFHYKDVNELLIAEEKGKE